MEKEISSQPGTLLTSEEYLRIEVEQYVRQEDGKWLYTETTDPNGLVIFETIACRISMAGLYHRVNFKIEE